MGLNSYGINGNDQDTSRGRCYICLNRFFSFLITLRAHELQKFCNSQLTIPTEGLEMNYEFNNFAHFQELQENYTEFHPLHKLQALQELQD